MHRAPPEHPPDPYPESSAANAGGEPPLSTSSTTPLRPSSHGTWLRVADPLEVARQSASVHARSGHSAYPPNVPANLYPMTVMIDAGGGITTSVFPGGGFHFNFL